MIRLSLMFTLLGTLLSFAISAQTYHTVSVGTFVNPAPQKFNNIRSLGVLHTVKQNGLKEIYLGRYQSPISAQEKKDALHILGFTNAEVKAYTHKESEEVPVVQIATRNADKGIDWEEFTDVKPLYLLVDNNTVKIMVGVFSTYNEAKSKLTTIKAKGFSDAFVKMVNHAELIEVDAVTTGIKEELIPIAFSNNMDNAPALESADTKNFVVKSPTVPRVPLPDKERGHADEVTGYNSLPHIRSNVQQNAVVELQRLLLNEGHYKGNTDGFYGAATAKASEEMLESNYTLQKYLYLYDLLPEAESPSNCIFSKWPEIQLLQSISLDLSSTPTTINTASRLEDLCAKQITVSPIESTMLITWEQNLWVKINRWATRDAYLTNLTKGMRYAYYQSMIRLENFYMDQGQTNIDARHSALAVVKGIVEAPLDRFK